MYKPAILFFLDLVSLREYSPLMAKSNKPSPCSGLYGEGQQDTLVFTEKDLKWKISMLCRNKKNKGVGSHSITPGEFTEEITMASSPCFLELQNGEASH